MPTLPNIDKHYSISKAAQELQITPQLLRQWETRAEFIPKRNERGHRYYTLEDIQFLQEFKGKINKRSYVTKNQEILEIKKRIERGLHKDLEVAKKVDLFKKVLKFSTLGLVVASFVLFGIMGMTSATFAQKYINKTALLGMFGVEDSSDGMDTKTANVLGERDQEPEFLFSINVPTNIGSDLTVEGDAVFEGDISTPGVNLLGTGTLAGVATIDIATQATLQGTLAVGGDLEGTLATALLSDGVLDGTEFADFVTLDGDLDVTGEIQADGDAGSDGQVLTSTGSGVEWLDLDSVDAETLDGVDSTGFLRSDTSDNYTSGTLAFSDATFLDLSLITHNDVAVQGFKLPQAASLVAPTTGEGFLAYDTDDDKILIYNGTSWTDVSGASTTLQQAYAAGEAIQLSATNGDFRISNDSSTEMFFADESTGRIGIGNISPLFKLDVTGTLGVSGTVDFDGLTSSTSENTIIVQNASGELLYREFSDFVEDDLIAVGEGATNFLPKWTGSRTLTDSSIYDNGTNVGIGTSSPNNNLNIVADNTGFNMALQLNTHTNNISPDGDMVGIQFGVVKSPDFTTTAYQKGALVYEGLTGNGNGSFHFLQDPDANGGNVGAQDAVFTITNAGDVGVGTTSPSYKLDVNGDVQIASGSELYSYGSATLGNRTYTDDRYVTDDQTFTASIDALDQQIYGIVAGESGIWLDRGTYIEPSTSAGNFAISDAGNVGIGTTSPGASLHVSGGNVFLENQLYASTIYPYSGALNLGDKVFIKSGNVGIGSTTPSSLLSVGASNQFTIDSSGDITKINNVAYSFPSSQAGASDYVLSNDGSGNLSWSSITGDGGLGALDGTGTANYLPLWSDANTLTSSSLYETGGQIGIGTTAPGTTTPTGWYGTNANLLEIASPTVSGSTGLLLRRNDNTAQGLDLWTDWADIYFDNRYMSNEGDFIFRTRTSGGSPLERLIIKGGGSVGIGNATPIARLDVKGAGTTTGFSLLTQDSSGAHTFAILDNGNVGIGTTAPAFLLDVAGTFGVSGAVDLDGLPSDSSEDSIVVQLADGTLSYREFSDFTADDGITDGVGTANYIPIWSDANTIGLSSIYETGGNVGIGTTDPSFYKLNVSGLAYFSSTISQPSTAGDKLLFAGSGNYSKIATDGNWGLNFYAGPNTVSDIGYMTFNVAKTTGWLEAMRINNSGNVGIGASIPEGRLHVLGTADDEQLIVQANGTQTANLLELQDSSGNVLSGVDERGILFSDGGIDVNSVYVGNDAGKAGATGTQNTGVGWRALQSVTTASGNAAFGGSSLRLTTTGATNSAFGSSALTSNTEGTYNVGLGAYALYKNTTGGYNTAINSGLYENTTGAQNIAIGLNSGRFIADGATANTTGDYNIFIGNSAKALADNDQNEIVIGYNATGIGSNTAVLGNDSITKTILKGSVGIGTTDPEAKVHISSGDLLLDYDYAIKGETSSGGTYRDLVQFSSSNTVTLGSTSADNSIIAQNQTIISTGGSQRWYFVSADLKPITDNVAVLGAAAQRVKTGYFGTGGLSVGDGTVPPASGLYVAGNVGIGTTSPSYTLDVLGTAQITGKVGIGGNAPSASRFELTIGGSNTQSSLFVGHNDGYGAVVGGGNSGGTYAWYGQSAAYNYGTSSIDSYFASYSGLLMDGGKVSIFAKAATPSIFFEATTGNVGIGTTAPEGQTHILQASAGTVTAHDSADALVLENSGTTGISILTPDSATSQILFGSPSNALAGIIQWKYDDNVLRMRNNNTSGTLALGVVGTNDALYIDSAGEVGIGTTAPGFTLDVNGAANFTGSISADDSLALEKVGGTRIVLDVSDSVYPKVGSTLSSGDTLSLESYGSVQVVIDSNGGDSGKVFKVVNDSTAGTELFTVQDDGDVLVRSGNMGIGTTAPAYALDVVASGTGIIARFSSDNSSGCTLADGGTISCTSDEELKTNITTLESSALGQVLGLNPVTFDWKSGESGQENLGFIAQDVELIIPQLVSVDAATGYKQLNTIGIIPLLTKAIQEQQTQIEALQALVGIEASESTSSASLASLEGTALYESMLTIFNEFKDFVEALGLSKQIDADGNEILAVSSDMNVTGTTTLADVKITGNLTAGLIEIDTLNNEINVLGASCYNSATATHNKELCDSQTLYIQKAQAGNLDILNGIVVIEPNGKMTLKGTFEAERLNTEQLAITTTDNPSAGSAIIEAGETTITINTDKVTDSTLILATPRTPVVIGTSFVEDGVFEIKISTVLESDLQVDWLLVGTE